MPLLGQLIKAAIELGKTLEGKTSSLGETQRNQLIELLRKAQNTSFGIYYGFEQILRSEDPVAAYREAVPIFNYEQMHRRWWAQQQKQAHISWPGKPQYFALSSGTTGKHSKRIPVTEDMLDSFRRVGISQALSLANFDLPGELFEKEVLMLGSSANLGNRSSTR